ncbi:hypothetical protein ACHAP5_011776 [Fusarium lateritium]
MSHTFPRITITAATDDRTPVLIFPFPVPDDETVSLLELFADQLTESQTAPEPTTSFGEHLESSITTATEDVLKAKEDAICPEPEIGIEVEPEPEHEPKPENENENEGDEELPKAPKKKRKYTKK